MPSHTRTHDTGFTLPEVLITVVMMGTIMTVIAAVAAVVLRNTPDAEARAEDARSMMGLVTWLPQDVDSTPPSGFDTDRNTAGCGVTDGTSVLHLQWTETLDTGTTTYVANYRHMGGANGYSLKRVTCSGTPPLSGGTIQNLTSELGDLPSSWDPGEAPLAVTVTPYDPIEDAPAMVVFEITTANGKIVRTDSAAKNPDQTLPSTTMPSWYIPTPTTGVYSNSQPETTSLTFDAYPAVATAVDLIVSDPDNDPLVIELVSGSLPAGWGVVLSGTRLTITPAASDEGLQKVIEYTVDDLEPAGPVTGTVTVTVVPTTTPTTIQTTTTTTPTTTTPTTTPPTCTVTGTNLSPSNVKNVPPSGGASNVDVGPLQKSIIVNATTNDECDGLDIRYESGGGNSPPFVNMTEVSANTWTVTLLGRGDGSAETWSDGNHTIRFFDASGGPWATATLKVN